MNLIAGESLVNPASLPGEPVVVVLEQFADGDRHFFFNSHDDALRFIERKAAPRSRHGIAQAVLHSNVAVFADGDSSNPQVDIRAAVESWVDTRGHIHTVAVLRKQMEFNRDRARADRSRRLDSRLGTLSSRYGYAPVRRDGLSEVKETGIVDTDTLHIPYALIALRFEELQATFHERCLRHSARPCHEGSLPDELFAYWKGAIDRAGEATADFKTRLGAIPVSGQPWIGSPRNWNDVFRTEFGGLTGIPVPIRGPGSPLYDVLRRGDPITVWPGRGQPEREIAESVPPEALGAATLHDLEVLERRAVAGIREAEALESDLFGDPR